MERTLLSPAMLRHKMVREGISQEALARESGIARPNISAILSGRQYCGAARIARLQDAFHSLTQAKVQAEPQANDDPPAPPTPRIRRLR